MLAARRMMGAKKASGPPPGYSAWYDASQIAGVADGTGIGLWTDLSSSGYNLTNGGPQGGLPVYWRTTPAHLVNGLPTVVFSSAALQNISSAATGIVQPYFVFAVTQFTAALSAFRGLWNSTGGVGSQVRGNANTGQWQQTDSAVLSGGTFDNNLVLVATLFDGASSALRVNRVQVATGNPGTDPLGALDLGTQAWDGPICEVLIYPSALSGPDISAVENYLRNKWGTP